MWDHLGGSNQSLSPSVCLCAQNSALWESCEPNSLRLTEQITWGSGEEVLSGEVGRICASDLQIAILTPF